MDTAAYPAEGESIMISPPTSTNISGGSSLVITQPMLMPWHGLFSQLILADRFLIYDDVQLSHGRGFTTRVQIKTPNGTEWLSIPVQRSGRGDQKICEALVANTDWRSQHIARIEQAYRKAPFFKKVFADVVLPIYSIQSEFLADFLVGSMEGIARIVGILTPFERTSKGDWANNFSSTDRIVEICRLSGVHNYLSGNGGMNYLNYEPFENSGVMVHYLSYKVLPYNQLNGDFTPYVSMIDLLFNVPAENVRHHLQTKAIYWRDWPLQINGRPSAKSE